MIEQQQRPGVALSCVVEDRMLDKSLTEVRKWRAHENKVDKHIQHLRYWINLLHKRRKVSFWEDILEGDKKDVYDLRFQKMNTWSHLELDRQTLTNTIYMRGFFSFFFFIFFRLSTSRFLLVIPKKSTGTIVVWVALRTVLNRAPKARMQLRLFKKRRRGRKREKKKLGCTYLVFQYSEGGGISENAYFAKNCFKR